MFFEGWYYKLAFENDSRTFAIIPGILINDQQRQAFLMVAHDNYSNFYRFSFDSFDSSSIDEPFAVRIMDDMDSAGHREVQFSIDQLFLDIEPNNDDDANDIVRINLTMSHHVHPSDISWILPGTMGPFSWFSFLQCYHHVLSMRFNVEGSVQIGSEPKRNVNGIGYIEKDWGKMFPSIWIWGQANQWIRSSTSNASIFFSFAIIPTGFGPDQPGFLIIFEHNNEFYRFNSYLLSVVHHLDVNRDSNTISFVVYDFLFEHKLQLKAYFNDKEDGAQLYGPRDGQMIKFVREILDDGAYFDVTLSTVHQIEPNSTAENRFERNGYKEYLLFEGRAHHVALEVNGNVSWLSENFDRLYGNVYPWKFSFLRSLVKYFRLIIFSLLLVSFISIMMKICK